MDSILFSKEAPVRYHAEVAVIGGGVAGLCRRHFGGAAWRGYAAD